MHISFNIIKVQICLFLIKKVMFLFESLYEKFFKAYNLNDLEICSIF
jgi:hypothetical protein